MDENGTESLESDVKILAHVAFSEAYRKARH